jgi:integrase
VRIPIGTFGDINTTPTSPGRWRARAKFRDQDGYCALEASGPSSKAAEQALKVKLAKRTRIGSSMGDLHPHSPFPDLVRVWLEDLELDTDLAQGTRDLYERDMRTLVLPVFEHFVLREITISKVDRFLRTLAKESYSRAKHAKVVLNLSLGLAHRYEAIERNPVTGTKRLKRPHNQPKALTLDQIQAIRAAARTWRRDQKVPGPRPDGQLEVIIEVMLGSSLRIGEVLALRKCDIDLTTSPATIRVAGTIVSPKGKATYRQPSPQDQDVDPAHGDPVLHRRSPARPHARPGRGTRQHAGPPDAQRDAVDDEQHPPTPAGRPSDRGHYGGHATLFPAHGGDHDRTRRRRRPRRPAPRPHIHGDHQEALHRARPEHRYPHRHHPRNTQTRRSGIDPLRRDNGRRRPPARH